MADATFQLDILTPSRREFAGEAVSLVAPGSEGYLGILAHHAPLITALQPGHLDVRLAGGETTSYHVSGGFLEVSANHAIVLADALELAVEIDVAGAQAAVSAAHAARRDVVSPPEVARAEQVLAMARARLRSARRQRGEGF
jgi:F-type H+-transporting ATPase subunit epsilon